MEGSSLMWLTRAEVDAIAAQGRRAALETISSALHEWPADRQIALLGACQRVWGVSPITASAMLANNAAAITAAYSLRGQIAGVLLIASTDGKRVCVGLQSAKLGEKLNHAHAYWIDFSELEPANEN
jgi:hypothetical protein